MKEKEKKQTLLSFLLLSLTILTCVSVLAFCLYGIYGLSSMMHYQKMDELNLEKEIATINNNDCDIETILKPLQDDSKIHSFCQERNSDINYLGWQNGKIVYCFDKTQDNSNIKYPVKEYLAWVTLN